MAQKQDYDIFFVMVHTTYDQNNRITPIITWSAQQMPKDINKICLYTADAAFAGNYSNPLYTVPSNQSYMKCSGIDMRAPTEYMLIGFFPFDGGNVPMGIGDHI